MIRWVNKFIKYFIFILLLNISVFSQGWIKWDGWKSWNNNSLPMPIAEWKWNYGTTTVDTGTTVVNSLVSNWLSTNNRYDVQQATATQRPIYDNTNGGINFDGIDDYLLLTTSINLGTTHTILVWLSFKSTAASAILSNDDYSYLLLYAGGNIYYRESGLTYVYFNFTPSLNIDYLIAIVRDENSVKMYINGIQQGTEKNLSNNGESYFKVIGRENASDGYYFSGYIANIKLYKKSLTDSQIKYIYNKGKP